MLAFFLFYRATFCALCVPFFFFAEMCLRSNNSSDAFFCCILQAFLFESGIYSLWSINIICSIQLKQEKKEDKDYSLSIVIITAVFS